MIRVRQIGCLDNGSEQEVQHTLTFYVVLSCAAGVQHPHSAKNLAQDRLVTGSFTDSFNGYKKTAVP